MKNTIYFSFIGSFKGYEAEINSALLEQMGEKFHHQELQDSSYEYYHHKANKNYMVVISKCWCDRYQEWNERSFVTSKKLVGGPCHPNLDMCHEFLRRV